jgi:hypothetical protein
MGVTHESTVPGRILASMTSLAFPEYRNLVRNVNAEIGGTWAKLYQKGLPTERLMVAVNLGTELISSLPLQVLLFFNVYVSLLWFIGMVYVTQWKVQ